MLFALLSMIVASDARPLSDPRTWASYPPAAMRNGDQGKVVFELAVSATGAAADCRITQSSGSALLDSETCRQVLHAARFSPAINAEGVAVASTYSNSFRWSLEGSDSPRDIVLKVNGLNAPLLGTRTVVRFDITGKGRVENCEIVNSSGSSKLDRVACEQVVKKGRFQPATDSNGQPRTSELSIRWESAS